MKSLVLLSLFTFWQATVQGHGHGSDLLSKRASHHVHKESPATKDFLDYVNPFIGTKNGGHVFSGATIPFGLVKAGIDTDSSDNQAGYVSDGSNVTGFSQLHDDGTGGAASLGNFKLFPFASCPSDDITQCTTNINARKSKRVANSDKASPGYFATTLVTGPTGELTSTRRVALHRYTFNSKSSKSSKSFLLVDLVNDLPNSFHNGTLTINKNGRITGSGNFNPSFGDGTFNVFFCMDTHGANISEIAVYDKSNNTTVVTSTKTYNGTTYNGAILGFSKAKSVLARVGISFISENQACNNAEEEIPSFDFAKTQTAARDLWRTTLGTVTVDTKAVPASLNELFYSSIYRTAIAPDNYTLENPLWQSNEPYWDSFYCLWDSFRAAHPLLTIIAPQPQSEMVRALIDIWRHEGWLPDCRMSLSKGYTQGGSNADTMLADTYVKGIKNGINWDDGYAAMKTDAENEPSDWDIQGRGNLASYHSLGYVPLNDTDTVGTGLMTRSASRTLEYAYNDFGLSLVAKGLGKSDDQKKYLGRSANWEKLFEPNLTDSGYSGFTQPRYKNGTFGYQDPKRCSPALLHDSCFLNADGGEFYEASSWEYSFYAPADMAKLISKMGGSSTFVKRLDQFFAKRFHDIGDEPGFLPCWLYNYAGQPSKTVDRVRLIMSKNFNESLNGIPGNDDSGAMGAFATFSLLGFFPVAGQSVYLLGSPYYPTTSFYNQLTGKTATIETKHFGGKNVYVQSATMDGKPYDKNWISHAFFSKGQKLVLTLGPKPSKWATSKQSVPPSISTGGY